MKRLVILLVLLVPLASAEQQTDDCWKPVFGYQQQGGQGPAIVSHEALLQAGMLENVVGFVEQTTDLSDYYGRQVSEFVIAHDECSPGNYAVDGTIVEQVETQTQPGIDKRKLILAHQLAQQEAYAPQTPSKKKIVAKVLLAAGGIGAGFVWGWPGIGAGSGGNLIFNMLDSRSQQSRVSRRYKRSLEAQGITSFADASPKALARAQYGPNYRQQPQTWAQEVAQIDTAGWR